ncbi:MAG: PDC sensor domain-containing protein, partial [Deltaproteobacteria bacterium]
MPKDNIPAQSWFIKHSSITLICIVLFILLSGITFFLCYNHYQDNKGLFIKEDRATARLLSLVMDEHIHMIIKTMESYANRPLLIHAVKSKNAEKAKGHLENMIKNNPDIDILVILDRGGTLWASYPERPESIGKNFAYREWYKGVSKDWKPHVSDVTLRVVEEKDLAVQISVPFIDDKGETIGILLNTQRVVGLAKIMQRVFVDPGTFTNIIDRT